MATIEELRVTATSEIEAAKPLYKQVNNERLEFESADYDQAIEDLAQAKLDEQDNGYSYDRAKAYDSVVDQLDLLYHDMTADKGDKTGEWYKAIKAVKDANPKP